MAVYDTEGRARAAVVRAIRARPTVTRADLSRTLGISPSVITRVVSSLIEEDLVIEGAAIERGAAGRRPTALSINGDAFHLVGVDVSGAQLNAAIVSLGGALAHVRTYSLLGLDGEKALDRVLIAIEELLALAQRDRFTVRGIGVGAPGVTDFVRGLVSWAPAFEWADLPLREIVEERFRIPTFIENDGNLAAIGEHWLGAGRDLDSLVHLFLAEGLGAGVILNGELVRGARRSAGEVGFIVPERRMLSGRHVEVGAVESVMTMSALRQSLGARPDELQRSLLSDLALGEISMSQLLAVAESGDSLAEEIAHELIDHLAMVVASIVAVIDPGVVILGGELADSGQWVSRQLAARLANVLPPDAVEVRPSQLGERAVVLGAAAFALLEVEDLHLQSQRTVRAQ